jgi:hypothetical protein
MEQDIRRLPNMVSPRGTNLHGLTSTLVQRTEKVAWFIRNDGYHEVFIIKTGLSFDKSGTMEYYPSNNDFGISAWCIKEKHQAEHYFNYLLLHQGVIERLAPERYIDTPGVKKTKTGRTNE